MKFLLSCVLPGVVVLAASFGYMQPAAAKNYLCNQQFALCTSAPCIPEPGNPKVAVCVCSHPCSA